MREKQNLKSSQVYGAIIIGLLLFSGILVLAGCFRPPLSDAAYPVQAAPSEVSSAPSGNSQVASSLQMLSADPTPTALTSEGGMIVVPPPTSENAQTSADNFLQHDDDLPESFRLDTVPVGKQTRPLNCEFQTASDLLWYYGYPYSWDEIYALVGPDPNGNPHMGFVGKSLDDPPGRIYPDGYGVYAEPIARSIETIGLYAEVHYGESAEWLKQQIAAGNPVMVWATANMIARSPEYWRTKDGRLVQGVRGEHTYLVFGYDKKGVWVADPWDGERHYYSWTTFLASWDILGRMSVLITDRTTDESTP